MASKKTEISTYDCFLVLLGRPLLAKGAILSLCFILRLLVLIARLEFVELVLKFLFFLVAVIEGKYLSANQIF